MSNEEFENYLALVSRLLRLSPGQRSQIGEELRDHLETRTAELTESGVERVAAVKQAIEEFGDAAVFAESFKSVSVQNRKRWMMRFATVCTAVAFLVVVLAMAMWPDGARFGTPSYSTAIDDTAKPAVIEKVATQSSRLSPMTQANEAIRQALKQSCVLEYDEEAFSDVVTDLQAKLKLNIVLTHSARDDSLPEDELVTVDLRGIPYSDALKIMLVDKNATYCVQDGVLKVISLDDAETDPKFLTRRMVNVSNLLTLIRKKESSRIGKLVTAESILIDVTQSAVQSEAWFDTESGLCQMKIVGGIMVLVATEQINDEVESFLIDLEFAMQTDRGAAPQANPIQEPAPKPAADSSNNQPPSDAQVVENPFGDGTVEEGAADPFDSSGDKETGADPFAS